MKSVIITIGLLLILVTKSYSQKGQFEYGLSTNPSLTFNQKYDRLPSFNFSTGLFVNYILTYRIGIGGALEYQMLKLNTFIWVFDDPVGNMFYRIVPSYDQFQIIMLPIWASINLNYNPEAKLKTLLVFGYSYGKLLDSKNKENTYRLWGLEDNVHFGTIGLELKRKFKEKYQITIGSHLDITNIYDKRYGEINNLQLILKLGKLKN